MKNEQFDVSLVDANVCDPHEDTNLAMDQLDWAYESTDFDGSQYVSDFMPEEMYNE